MAISKKHLKVGDVKIYDTEIIYARAMGLQSSSLGLDTNELVSHELAHHQTSMFDGNGHIA